MIKTKYDECNQKMNEKHQYSVPILDEPFAREFTEMVYQEDETDYSNTNSGKPYHSFIVCNNGFNSSGYIRSFKQAEQEVARRIGKQLDDHIEYTTDRLKKLKAAKQIFKQKGIHAFKVKRDMATKEQPRSNHD